MAVAAMMGVPQVSKNTETCFFKTFRFFQTGTFAKTGTVFNCRNFLFLKTQNRHFLHFFCENPNPNRNCLIVPQVLIVRESSTGENGGMVTVKHLRRKEEAEVAWAEVPRYLLRARRESARRTLTARESSRSWASEQSRR